jgi:hypothetical protein
MKSLYEQIANMLENVDASVSIYRDIIKDKLSPCIVCIGCEVEDGRCPCKGFCPDEKKFLEYLEYRKKEGTE